MIDVRDVAIIAAAGVTGFALLQHQDGVTLTAFFSFLAGLGLGRMQPNGQSSTKPTA